MGERNPNATTEHMLWAVRDLDPGYKHKVKVCAREKNSNLLLFFFCFEGVEKRDLLPAHRFDVEPYFVL